MRSILLLAAALVVFAVPAHAFPHFTVTACDTVSTSPLQVKTTFTLDMPGPIGPWYEMNIMADPASGTHLLGCGGSAAGWRCTSLDVGYYGAPPPTLEYVSGEPFQTGDHLEGFAILADRAAPCVYILFMGPILGDNGSYFVTGCLAKDAPVPAGAVSWGKVKSLYR